MKRPTRFSLPAALAFAAMATGCASTVNGTTQKVRIETQPTGATVRILQTGQEFTAPVDVELPRKRVYTVRATMDGRRPAYGYIDRVASPVLLGNLLVGGLIGVSVDKNSGAAFELTPDPLVVPLAPAEAEEPAPPAVAAPPPR